jgi:hypothetical protein
MPLRSSGLLWFIPRRIDLASSHVWRAGHKPSRQSIPRTGLSRSSGLRHACSRAMLSRKLAQRYMSSLDVLRRSGLRLIRNLPGRKLDRNRLAQNRQGLRPDRSHRSAHALRHTLSRRARRRSTQVNIRNRTESPSKRGQRTSQNSDNNDESTCWRSEASERQHFCHTIIPCDGWKKERGPRPSEERCMISILAIPENDAMPLW